MRGGGATRCRPCGESLALDGAHRLGHPTPHRHVTPVGLPPPGSHRNPFFCPSVFVLWAQNFLRGWVCQDPFTPHPLLFLCPLPPTTLRAYLLPNVSEQLGRKSPHPRWGSCGGLGRTAAQPAQPTMQRVRWNSALPTVCGGTIPTGVAGPLSRVSSPCVWPPK